MPQQKTRNLIKMFLKNQKKTPGKMKRKTEMCPLKTNRRMWKMENNSLKHKVINFQS